jgi:short-subunit dehydrogenase
MSDRPRALITGASAGLGREYAEQLARDGYDLVLAARGESELRQAAQDLAQEHHIHVDVCVADLATQRGIDDLTAVIDHTRIDVLVNNAGFGLKTSMLDSTADQLIASDMVMLRSVTLLSRAAAVRMRERGRGGIVNVSSLAAFGTEALAAELADTPVTVTAVLPGFITTEFHDRMRVRRAGPSWLWLDAERVVADSLADARRGRIISVPSTRYKAVYAAAQLVPHPLVRFLSDGLGRSRRGKH